MKRRSVIALLMISAAFAAAEDLKAKAARAELEHQLRQMVGSQPSKVRVDFVSLEEPNYQLEEAVFELDGRTLTAPAVKKLSAEGTSLVWNGEVSPGKHSVKVLLVYVNATSAVLSDEGGYKWKVAGSVSFDVQAGLEVRVQVVPTRDSSQREIGKRFKLALPAQPVMLAQVDDGQMPEAPPPAVVDAGVLSRKQQAAEAKRLAQEEKQRLAAEAKTAREEAKRQAAAERQAKLEAAREAKRQAAAEREARLEAARESKRTDAPAERPVEAPPMEAEPPAAPAEVPSALDAGVEVVDAGSLAVAELAKPDVPQSEGEDDGVPWGWIVGAGGVAGLVFLVLVARRRARPPSLDE